MRCRRKRWSKRKKWGCIGAPHSARRRRFLSRIAKKKKKNRLPPYYAMAYIMNL